jgi:mersacidin/lichenicidin family type 2 lantibiotic
MKFDVVRTWKNANIHQERSEEQFNSLPAGEIELTDEELQSVSGGYGNGLLTVDIPISLLSGNIIPILGSVSDSVANGSSFGSRYTMGTRFDRFAKGDWLW